MSKKLHAVYIQTKYGHYQCVLEPDERRGFIITVPGLPEVITWGKSTAHAKKMAQEAIELCVECRVEKVLHRAKTAPRRISREPLAV